MSAQHTPGPWMACLPGDYGDFDGESRVICGDDQRIAVAHWHPRLNTDESDANATLIAASPELLAALDGLVRALELWSDGRFAKRCPAHMQDARDAIAKATGAA